MPWKKKVSSYIITAVKAPKGIDISKVIKTFAALEYSLSEAGYKVGMGASVGVV
ncbi:hypothetical protein [Clostridium sp. BNL1100]|uniref:hypothetical protein n=1 Tax=Clostridium sp. BNL1100 TaxID=755731 RepID=UPI00024A7ABE|nr:hypothetical protein [Clostridium sp. BNL1100]AEY67019.1 hypothetical protein Clo1100_2866 [Clostridium sp. BNL1100]